MAVTAAALLGAGLIAIAAALSYLDPRSLADSFAAAVKAATGRDLRLGAVELTLLPRPALALRDVRFGNASWGSRPWLAQAGQVSADIDILALLARRLRIQHITLADASIFLETDRSGNGNWAMSSPDAGAPAWLESLLIDGVELRSLAFAYRDGATGETTSAQLDEAGIDVSAAARQISLHARGTFAGKQVEAAGTIGALRALLADAPAYPVELGGKLGAASVSLKGTIDKPRALDDLKLALSVKTAELGEFATLWGGRVRALGAFSGTAQLIGSAAAPGLTAIEAVLGGGERPEIRLRGAVADIRAANGIDLKLAASTAKSWRFGTAASGPQLPPFRAGARLRDAQSEYRFDELELQVAADSAAKASTQVMRGGQLALKDGRLSARALKVVLGGAKVTLDGVVADPKNLAGIDLGIALQGDEMAELFKFFGVSIRALGRYQGRARMQGSLDSLRLAAIDLQTGPPKRSLHASGQIEDLIHWKGMQLALTANVSDRTGAGVLFGVELPVLPAFRATARIADAPGGYAFEDLKLTLGRTSMEGRVVHILGGPRPRIVADLRGPLADLSELPRLQRKPGGTNPLLAADVEAKIRFERVVLPDRRALGPVSGGVRLEAGAVELKQFTVAVEGASATLEGRIGDPLAPVGIDLMANAKVTHATGLEALAGKRLPMVPAFTASGRLTDLPNGYALAGLKFAHAATTITGELTVTRGEKRFKISAKGNSPLLDVSTLFVVARPESAAKPKAAGTRAIPDVPLPNEILRLIDADLDLRFDAVKIGDAPPLGAMTARAVIAEGRLMADVAQVIVKADQALGASASVDAAKNASTLRIEGKGIDFGDLLARFGYAGVVTGGSTDVSIQLQGRDKSLTALLGSLYGDVRVAVGPHRIHNFAVNPEGGLVLRLFALANPFQKSDPDTEVKCFAVSLPVRNGVLTSERNIAIETAKYNLVASGTVNLGTERIDAAVTPVVRSEAGTVVRVGGTLAAPSVGIDVAGAAKSAVSLGAAVVAPAWWLADSLIKKAVSDPHPCATALARQK